MRALASSFGMSKGGRTGTLVYLSCGLDGKGLEKRHAKKGKSSIGDRGRDGTAGEMEMENGRADLVQPVLNDSLQLPRLDARQYNATVP